MDRETVEVRRFLSRLRQSPYHIERAIVFGSRARGDHLVDSDLDLILVSKDFEDVFFTDRSSQVHRYWDGDLGLEVLCYTPEEFEKKRRMIGLIQDAVREGVEIPVNGEGEESHEARGNH
ncbi:MAG: nucleotidyltransferase domain-containing protein [Anaerolineae bacterium]